VEDRHHLLFDCGQSRSSFPAIENNRWQNVTEIERTDRERRGGEAAQEVVEETQYRSVQVYHTCALHSIESEIGSVSDFGGDF
jgi:hypothetical protein